MNKEEESKHLARRNIARADAQSSNLNFGHVMATRHSTGPPRSGLNNFHPEILQVTNSPHFVNTGITYGHPMRPGAVLVRSPIQVSDRVGSSTGFSCPIGPSVPPRMDSVVSPFPPTMGAHQLPYVPLGPTLAPGSYLSAHYISACTFGGPPVPYLITPYGMSSMSSRSVSFPQRPAEPNPPMSRPEASFSPVVGSSPLSGYPNQPPSAQQPPSPQSNRTLDQGQPHPSAKPGLAPNSQKSQVPPLANQAPAREAAILEEDKVPFKKEPRERRMEERPIVYFSKTGRPLKRSPQADNVVCKRLVTGKAYESRNVYKSIIRCIYNLVKKDKEHLRALLRRAGYQEAEMETAFKEINSYKSAGRPKDIEKNSQVKVEQMLKNKSVLTYILKETLVLMVSKWEQGKYGQLSRNNVETYMRACKTFIQEIDELLK